MLNLNSSYKKMGGFSRHVLKTSLDENYILDTASSPLVVDQQHCQTDGNLYKRKKQYTVNFHGLKNMKGTLGHLKEDSHKRLLEKMNFQHAAQFNQNLPVAVCVPNLKSMQTSGLNEADGIIGLALAGGQQHCVDDNCVSSADVNLLKQMNAYGFTFKNQNDDTQQKEPQTRVQQGSLCGLASIRSECALNRMYQSNCQYDSTKSSNTIGVVAARDYNHNNIRNNDKIKLMYPSHCTQNGNLLLDTGWPREEDNKEDFKTTYNVDMIDEGQIQSMEVNYKDKTISYTLV